MNAKWTATISDGTVAAEHSGEWVIIPGQRKPWIRLCQKLASEGKWITSLRLNIDGKTIHLPRENNKFPSLVPDFYSVCYHAHTTMNAGSNEQSQENFVDISAHYEKLAVHYIYSIEKNNSWVTVNTDPAVAPSPKKKITTNN